MLLACPQQDKPQAVLLPGDLSYADDYNLDDRFGYQPRWDAWGRLSQKLFGTVPLISGIGALDCGAAHHSLGVLRQTCLRPTESCPCTLKA